MIGDLYQTPILKPPPPLHTHTHTHTHTKQQPENARLRLGLSATPFHYINDDANARLKGYFGDVVSEYSLKDALDDDVLTQYEYHIIPVELTDDEAEEYSELSYQIGQRFKSSKSEEDEYLGNLKEE